LKRKEEYCGPNLCNAIGTEPSVRTDTRTLVVISGNIIYYIASREFCVMDNDMNSIFDGFSHS